MRIVLVLVLSVFAGAAFAAKKNTRKPAAAAEAQPQVKKINENFDGTWVGFCSPSATSGTSKLCTYVFKKDGSGDFSCEYFKDLRCTTKDTKTLKAGFKFMAIGVNEKDAKLNIDYADREDIRQEKARAFITGDVLRLQIYEVLRMPDVKDEKLEAQGVIPFFEFTRKRP